MDKLKTEDAYGDNT